jgi:hypothetical protein
VGVSDSFKVSHGCQMHRSLQPDVECYHVVHCG